MCVYVCVGGQQREDREREGRREGERKLEYKELERYGGRDQEWLDRGRGYSKEEENLNKDLRTRECTIIFLNFIRGYKGIPDAILK